MKARFFWVIPITRIVQNSLTLLCSIHNNFYEMAKNINYLKFQVTLFKINTVNWNQLKKILISTTPYNSNKNKNRINAYFFLIQQPEK
jgi:hypothetical protein